MQRYQGEAANNLWDRMRRTIRFWERHYAYNIDVVQSSGMGKSRLVDELSKQHLVIPISLLGRDSAGMDFVFHSFGQQMSLTLFRVSARR